MYNDDLKLRYLETIDNNNTKDICRKTFELISKYESMFNKDVCHMGFEELGTFINKLAIVKGGTTNKGREFRLFKTI